MIRTFPELSDHPGWKDISAARTNYVSAWKAEAIGDDIFYSSVIQFSGVGEASCAVLLMPRGVVAMAATISDVERGMRLCDHFVDLQRGPRRRKPNSPPPHHVL